MKLAILSIVMLAAVCVAAPASQAETTVTAVPLDIVPFIPCANNGAGEFVALSGTLRETITVVQETQPVGYKMLRFQFTWTGFSGVGLATGNSYVLAGTAAPMAILSDNGYLTTYVSIWRLIGLGASPDLRIQQVLVTSFDSSTGVITRHVDKFSSTCG